MEKITSFRNQAKQLYEQDIANYVQGKSVYNFSKVRLYFIYNLFKNEKKTKNPSKIGLEQFFVLVQLETKYQQIVF